MDATLRSVLLYALKSLSGKLTEGEEKPSVGSYNIEGQELLIRFHGSVTQGADYERTPTVSIPLIPALMLCLSKAGIVGPALQRMLMESMREALNADEAANEHIKALLANAEEAERQVRAGLATLPKVPCSGPFVTKGAKAEALSLEIRATPL